MLPGNSISDKAILFQNVQYQEIKFPYATENTFILVFTEEVN